MASRASTTESRPLTSESGAMKFLHYVNRRSPEGRVLPRSILRRESMDIRNVKNRWQERWNRLSRRDLFRSGSLLSVGGLLQWNAAVAAPPELRIGPEVYQSIGVRPLINARGTITVITGSQTLPEVKAAMDAASRHFVQIDELMD